MMEPLFTQQSFQIFSMKYLIYFSVFFISSICKLSAQVMPQGYLVDMNVPSVVIGSQTWMAKDLDVALFKDGTEMGLALTTANWIWYVNHPSASNDAWVFPTAADAAGNFKKSNPDYGKLYNWYAVTNSLGACPVNYHVPSKAEWETLITYLGGSAIAGGKLKEAGTLHWAGTNTGTNESKFTAVPGGYMGGGASLGYAERGYYWASDAYNASDGYVYYLDPASNTITEMLMGKVAGAAIRCIHN